MQRNVPNRQDIFLHLLLYLLKETDEDHPKSRKELTAVFMKTVPDMTERYVRDAINTFRSFGFPIEETIEGHTHLYYSRTTISFWLYSTLFVLAESAKYLSRTETGQIIDAICLLAPKGTKDNLVRSCCYSNLVKPENGQSVKSISGILKAITENRKLSLVFTSPGYLSPRYPLGEDPVTVSPIALVPNSDKLYLACRLEPEQLLRNFRIENLRDVKVLEEPISTLAVSDRDQLSADCKGRFNMFQGDRCENVTLAFPEHFLRSIYDRFGENIPLTKIDEADGEPILKTTVSVEVSPFFYWWVIESGGKMRIIGPDWVHEDLIVHMHKNGLTYYSEEKERKKKQPGSANPSCLTKQREE